MKTESVMEQDGRWFVTFDYKDDENADALIHQRFKNSSVLYAIATVEDLPLDENGDLIRSGQDAVRMRELCLIANAPDMLEAIDDAVKELEEVTGLHKPDNQCGTWICNDETQRVWRRLIDIQGRLERVSWDAIDLENF